MASDIRPFHQQTQLLRQAARFVGAGFDCQSVNDFLDGLLAAPRGHMRGLVWQRELDRYVYENAALEPVRFDDVLDDIEDGVQLSEGRFAAALANHRAERVLEPL